MDSIEKSGSGSFIGVGSSSEEHAKNRMAKNKSVLMFLKN